MVIWHDSDCQGYKCGCTTIGAAGKWRRVGNDDSMFPAIEYWGVNVEEPQTERAKNERAREERRLERERIKDTYGEDDFDNGTMLRFYKLFKSGDQVYTYGAVKSRDYWNVTGRDDVMSWIDLIEFFERDNLLLAEAIFIPVDYERLFDIEGEE